MKKSKPISYGRQTIGSDDIRSVVAALKSDRLTQGPLMVCDAFRMGLAVGPWAYEMQSLGFNYRRILSLPIYPLLRSEDAARVVRELKKAVGGAR
jgi:dTDP-4-amino-4,6-dideoxygalactose transaminase